MPNTSRRRRWARSLLTTTHERHVDLRHLLGGLPREALDWRPAPDAASLAGLTLHILDVEEYLARLAAGEPTRWSGENGSRMGEAADEATLVAAIVACDGRVKRALEALDDAALAGSGPGGATSLGEAIASDLDHCAMHYGQAQLTRHLWETKHPAWRSSYIHWR